jgi:hypothetical protein
MSITRPEFRCADCEGTDAPLYESPRNDGQNIQIVHACEHEIRAWYPDAPEISWPPSPEYCPRCGREQRADNHHDEGTCTPATTTTTAKTVLFHHHYEIPNRSKLIDAMREITYELLNRDYGDDWCSPDVTDLVFRAAILSGVEPAAALTALGLSVQDGTLVPDGITACYAGHCDH